MDELAVDINHPELHAIDIETDRFETAEPFRIRIQNHGEPSHVHLSFQGELADAVSIPEPNHFVRPEEDTVVPVQLIPARLPTTGQLEVSLAYGSKSESVTIDLTDRSVPDRTVSELSTADSSTPNGTGHQGGGLANRRWLSVVGVAILAVVAAVIALIQTNFNPIVFAGVAVVFGTIGGGFVYILWQ